ncbi:MAG: 4-phosphoerythronate dehydrogenase [Legionella sp.]|nr:4-phosphoerythronate dehydrogenase [Legionella sp.]
MNILADASLNGLSEAFPAPFVITTYKQEDEITVLLRNQDVLLCRSTLKVNAALLKQHALRYVATASSGIDHIDLSYLKSNQIQVLDAKGSNANAVTDYVLCCIAYLQTQQVIKGNQLGVIGVGEVGSKVYTKMGTCGFNVLAYDPLKAETYPDFKWCTQANLFECDVLCIHAELQDTTPYPSRNLIDAAFLARLKPGCILINAARGGIVNEQALLSNQQSLVYCTDVYLNEPAIDARIITKAKLCTPHIAGHSLEAKQSALRMLSQKLHKIAGLRAPIFAPSKKIKLIQSLKQLPWQQQVLCLYDPLKETLLLKQAVDKQSAFLLLRKQHNTRHDFSVYDFQGPPFQGLKCST